MWNVIETQEDINKLQETFGWFHDSCIKEIKYLSGAFVNQDMSMQAVNTQRVLRMIIQRQYSEPTAIEMLFSGLRHMQLHPEDENYTCEIVGATLIMNEDLIFWGDSEELSAEDFNGFNGTWVCAQKLMWRIADEYTGKDEVYVPSR
jgi:hypothetical protein